MAKNVSKTVVGDVDYAELDGDKLHELGALLIPGFDPSDYNKSGLVNAIVRQASRRKLNSEKAIDEFLEKAYSKSWGEVPDDDEWRDLTFENVLQLIKKSKGRVDPKKYNEDSEPDRIYLIRLLHRRCKNKDLTLAEVEAMTGGGSGGGGRPITIPFDIEDGFDGIPTEAPEGVTEAAVEIFKMLYDSLNEGEEFECGRTSLDGKRPYAVARYRGTTVSISLPKEYSTLNAE